MLRRLLTTSFLLAFLCAGAEATTVRLQTTQGNIDIDLYDTAAPVTVANFLSYVNSGAYSDSLVHRAVPGFIIQGGGYFWNNASSTVDPVATHGSIINEFNVARSNLRGTIAMAKLSGDPNSATSQWFINLADNSSILDGQNGGFTVFGKVTAATLPVADAIVNLQNVNAGAPFDELPISSFPPSGILGKSNLVLVQSASVTNSSPGSGARLKPGVIDIDGTGLQNIVVRKNDNTAMQVGRFANNKFTFTAQDDPGANFRLVAAPDLDGNGKSDLVFLDTTMSPLADVRIWTDFQRSSERLWRQVKPAWDAQVVGDLDGDGNADIAWRYLADDPRDTGVSYIWFYNGAQAPVVRKRGGAPLSWTLLGAGDYDKNGSADMVYLSSDGLVRVLMATGNRTCANFAADNFPAGYTPLALADFTGSRTGDILLRNLTTGQNTIRVMSAAGLTLPPFTGNPDDPNVSCTPSGLNLTSVNFNYPLVDPTWKFYAAGDFDGDGYTDIVWLRPDGTLTLWRMNPTSVPTVVDNAGTAPAGYKVFQPGGGGGASF